jgi:protein TonB
LWAGSALAALLGHLAVATLLFVSWSRRLPPPTGSSYTPNAFDVDVEVAPAPAPAPVPVPTPAPPTRASTDSARRTPSALQLKALPEMVALTSDPSPPPIPQPALTPAQSAAQQSLTSADSLTSVAPLDEPNDSANSQSPGWLAEVQAQLERYKQYPQSALRRRQQDIVRLQFSVDRTGHVTSFHIDSAHHYKALEQEVQHMLLAAPFPAPPAYISADAAVNKDVAFSLAAAKLKPARSIAAAAAAAACSRPTAPGPAPAGASSTFAQMHTYQDQLQQYAAATRSYLGCLAPAHATSQADTAVTQVNALVARFNTQAQEFKKAEELRAQKMQHETEAAAGARFEQARGMTAKAYVACTASLPRRRPPPATTLTASALPAYRKQLVAYEAAVYVYVACIDQARHAVGLQVDLTPEQRIALEVDATNTGRATMAPLNRLIVAFNTQLHKLQQESISTQKQPAAVFARASAPFPNSTWSVPAPLPSDECIRIARIGKGYVAQLCNSSYVTNSAMAAIGAKGAMAEATQQEAIAAMHGVAGAGPGKPILGIGAAPSNEAAYQATNHPQTTSYTVDELHVAGAQVTFTIHVMPGGASGGEDPGSVIHFDLMLSPDEQNLRGRCSTGPLRRNCQLSRRL